MYMQYVNKKKILGEAVHFKHEQYGGKVTWHLCKYTKQEKK